MKKFLYIYALVFSIIWIGYGLYALLTNQPSAHILLGFGVAFSIVIFATSWLSGWLMNHYKNIDAMAKKILSKN
ncbi:hypothetical protein [Oceanobacillus halotolerans]|uniref:hypothetical protein n=1 Tax=Oceanobacillus halotolerans TaxID=2663380 RepID=UPI0013DB7F36|nr:hypothetical protein [Oceanobacillus halotolerans]